MEKGEGIRKYNSEENYKIVEGAKTHGIQVDSGRMDKNASEALFKNLTQLKERIGVKGKLSVDEDMENLKFKKAALINEIIDIEEKLVETYGHKSSDQEYDLDMPFNISDSKRREAYEKLQERRNEILKRLYEFDMHEKPAENN